MNSGISVILKAQHIGTFLGVPVTNALVMTWLVMILLIGFAYFFGRSLKLTPGKFQAGIEWALEATLDYMAEVLESRERAKRFFPLVASIFLFIALANALEFFPGVGSIGFFKAGGFVPVFRTPTTDLNLTLMLAAVSFFTIEITGIASLGVFRHLGKYVNLKSPLGFVVGLLELISNLGRLISFSFRLFGNIFAGEVLVLVAGFFVPYLLPAPFIGFEMFIGFVQAVVFAMLTLFFIKLAIMEPQEVH